MPSLDDDGNIVLAVTLPQVFILASLLIPAHGHFQSPPAVPRQFNATVVAIHDGDTISVRTARETIRIRLEGIDCPEYRQPYSSRAKRFVSELVHGKAVAVEGRGEDQYGRLLARVRVDGVEVNETLVKNGLAWHYQRGEIDPALAAAERAARASRVGLWADKNPVPPWLWRRDHPR